MCAIAGVDCVTLGEPSPKVKVYAVMESPASGSEEPAPLSVVASGASPLDGVAVSTAVGGAFGRSLTVTLTVAVAVRPPLSLMV